jgi:hypothetical protein
MGKRDHINGGRHQFANARKEIGPKCCEGNGRTRKSSVNGSVFRDRCGAGLTNTQEIEEHASRTRNIRTSRGQSGCNNDLEIEADVV